MGEKKERKKKGHFSLTPHPKPQLGALLRRNYGLGPVTRRSRLEKGRDETISISFRLVTFGLETDITRPSRISSRLVTCRLGLGLVSSRDFRLVTGSTMAWKWKWESLRGGLGFQVGNAAENGKEWGRES